MDESSEEDIEDIDDNEEDDDNLDWYRPIDPTIYRFLKDYYHSRKRNRFRNSCMPCIFPNSPLRHLGACTLLKRRMFKKLKYSSGTNVIFANFSSYELEITVKTIATNLNGCSIGLFGNNVTIDVSKTDPIPQTICIQPILYEYNLIKRVINDDRILKYSTKNKLPKSRKHLIIPKCLSASTAQIDPASRSYYLTVKVKQKNCFFKDSVLFEDLLYHSNYDVIFENIHLDSDEIGEQIDKRISKLESL
tara:strand:- start:885 stop:1628 length:744 start_codon:yes stop_codon:yes gene_type:complete